MNFQLTTDTSGLDRASVVLAQAMGQIDWITARAMTAAGKTTRDAIARSTLPKVKGGPTRWTERGLVSSMARPRALQVQMGFRFGTGRFDDEFQTPGAGVTPQGRYMTTNVRGGFRPKKSTESLLTKANVIDKPQRLIPVDEIDKRGNMPGGRYRAISKELIATGQSRRITPSMTTRERRSILRTRSRYFLIRMQGHKILSSRQPGGRPSIIAERIGKDKRGFVAKLMIEDRPNYKRRFYVEEVAHRVFMKEFKNEFEKGLFNELARRLNR